MCEGDCESKVEKGKKRISLVGRRRKGKKKKLVVTGKSLVA
jgi:hypothetical protein